MTTVTVPADLAASHLHYFGEAGRRWIDALPALAGQLLRRWRLRLDGAPLSGAVALVLPVVRHDGLLAALKLQPVDDETVGEAMALRCWAGLGAVRVLEHDPETGSILLERLDAGRSLTGVEDDLAALEVITALLGRFTSVPAPAGLRRLSDIADRMAERARVLQVPHQTDRELLTRCRAGLAEVMGDSVNDRLLHWDLHYDNVLATLERDSADPWRAIDPKPLAGDPGFELLPALWNRWSDVVATGDVRRAVLRRFDLMVDGLGLDWERARDWTLARVLQNGLEELQLGGSALDPAQRAIATSLLSRHAG